MIRRTALNVNGPTLSEDTDCATNERPHINEVRSRSMPAFLSFMAESVLREGMVIKSCSLHLPVG